MDELIAIPMAQRQQIVQNAVKNHGKRLFSFIRSRVKNDEDAEDILQDVWFRLISIIDSGPIEQLGAWLYRVSRNRIVDMKRKQGAIPLEDLAYEDEEGELMYPQELITENINPQTELERKNLKEAFYTALDELPDKQKEVFILNEIEDMTLQEIADKSGESIKTIISRKRYAVMYLRERLQNLYK